MSLLSRNIEVYDFYRGTRHWRLTGGDRDAIVEGQTYTAIDGLKRGRLVQSAEIQKGGLDIEMPLGIEFLEQFSPTPPMSAVHLNFKRIRVSDGLVRTAWMGVVSDVEDDGKWATVKCQSLSAAMAARGLRRTWQVPCAVPLYSAGNGMCNVNPDDFRADAVPADAGGYIVRAGAFAAYGDHYFRGGFLRYPDGAEFEHVHITDQVGDTLFLLTPVRIAAGVMVSAFPGCDHSMLMCHEKFDNSLNYAGQHTLPTEGPFDGQAVF